MNLDTFKFLNAFEDYHQNDTDKSSLAKKDCLTIEFFKTLQKIYDDEDVSYIFLNVYFRGFFIFFLFFLFHAF